MAVAQGYGKTVTSGSVFAYDTGDTRNSYRGEPTVNVFPDPKILNGTSGWAISNATGGTTTVDTGRNGGQSLKITVASGGDQYQYKNYGYGVNKGGTTFTYSAYIKTSGISGTGAGMSTYWFDINGNFIWSSISESSRITGTQDWTRVTATSTAPAGTYYVVAIFYPVDKNGVGTYWITDIHIEEKSHATSFTTGTRSATQGLLPLVGNSTIDLTNVSFDSNAQMTFDGTDDTLDLGIPVTTLAALSNFSMECVVKIDNYPSAASPNGYGSTTKKGVLLGATYYSGVAFYWAGNSSGTACNVNAYIRGADAQRGTGTYNLTPGSYHHLMLVNDRSNTTLSLYANGALISQVTGPSQEYNATLIPNAGNIGISKAQVDGGGTDVYSYLPVNVPVTKIYTRALSASEVRQNYLHYKTRFNLS